MNSEQVAQVRYHLLNKKQTMLYAFILAKLHNTDPIENLREEGCF